MKTKIYILVLLFLAAMGIMNAQTEAAKTTTDPALSQYNLSFWNAYADKIHLNAAEKKEFMAAHQKTGLLQQRIQVVQSPIDQQNSRQQNQSSVLAGPCINIDFENGSLNGWTPTSGFNPLYAANTSGCCLTPGGQQTIMSGTGVDPAGGFPVVAPGGNYSLRLGSSQTGGLADRIEQTFMVTASNANFTYKYAVVMQDPGHTLTQQPSFQIEMLDSLGVQIPCTFYSVAAGNNVPGFVSSPNIASVVYKPWSSVVADLTALIGQNITIRFTTYDCSLGGHYGYAYIDGSCMSFIKGSNDTICAGTQKTYCAPNGFLSTTWNGPGMVNNTSQCISASAPGIYTCQTVLIPGCPGPDFTYTLSNFPKPVVSFTPASSSACSQQFTMANSSTISTGNIASYAWNFGGANTSTLQNPGYNFPSTGNYSISLISTSDHSCKDTSLQSIVIYPFPTAGFNALSGCLNSNIAFTNTSSITTGSISAYAWNLGNGNTSSLVNPTATYTNSGSMVISLTVTSNQNCVASQSHSLTVYPKPSAAFNNNALSACAPQYTFTNMSSIGSGSIASYNWNFGNSNTSALQSPVYNFPAAGNYTVSMIVTSSQNCKDTLIKTLAIYPFPAVSFLAQPFCLNSSLTFTNSSVISLGSINSYSWNFGNGNNSAQLNPTVNYLSSGSYVVTLSATSNQNCVATATSNVVVYPIPTASMSASNFCFGSSTSFVNNCSVSSGSLASFAWDFGDGTTSNSSSGSHAYTNSGTYTVSLAVTSNQNCVSSISNTLSIHPLPVVSYNISNVCYGNNTLFTNNSSIPAGIISSYAWSFGNGLTSTLTNPAMTYSGSGSYVVSLTATSGQSCVSTVTNNVVIHPLPVISFSATRVCFGDSTSFANNNSISSGSIVSYAWNFGDGNTSNVTSPVHTYSNYGSNVVSLTATSNQNCASNYTSNLVINPLPVMSFSATNVCLGNNTSFFNSSTIPSGNISSWAWNFGNNQSGSPLANPGYTYTLPGTYTVSLQGTSNKNCVSAASRVIKVFPNPLAAFNASNVCLGKSSAFINNSSIASPDQLTSYSWTFGNGLQSNFQNPAITYTAGGNYQVKLTVTSNNNCSNAVTIPLTIYRLPQVNFSPTSACKNQATQFTNSSSVNPGFISKCKWDFENDGTWDDTVNVSPIITYPNHGVFSCKLQVETNFQCVASATNNVTVHANPVADFSNPAVCLGDATNFVNKSTSIDGNITSYQWDFNGDNIIDNLSPSPVATYSANGTFLVKLEVQTQYGCTNVKSNSGRINAKPMPNFISKNNKGCPTLNVNIENTSYILTGSIVTTQWQFGDGSLPDYSQNPSHAYNVGSYDITLKVVSDSGCISTLVQPGFVTVYTKPVAGFRVDPDEIDENEPIMNVKSTATDGSITRYYVNDGSNFGTPNFTHTYKDIDQTKPMVVQIVRNDYGCTDTTFEVLKVKPAFVIYIPNTFTPNGDGLNDNFQAKGVGITKFSIQIYDRWGHLLYETDDINNPWDGTVRGSTDPIAQGVYVWKARVIDLMSKSHDLSGHVSLIR